MCKYKACDIFKPEHTEVCEDLKIEHNAVIVHLFRFCLDFTEAHLNYTPKRLPKNTRTHL